MFDNSLIGNRNIRESLIARLNTKSLSGAMLFIGPNSIGKRRVAFELVQRELCATKSACGSCQNCLVFQGQLPIELPNMLRIIPEGKAGIIRIGAIRGNDLVDGGLITWVYRTTLYDCHRWVIIEDAHRLSAISANILLKTIEDPPRKTHFILITHRPNSVLSTIRSRCEQVVFKTLSNSEIWPIAQKHGLKDNCKETWLALSSGTLQYLQHSSFEIMLNKINAWLDILSGISFNAKREAILPKKNLNISQGEQLQQSLETLLMIIKDIQRCSNQYNIQLTPWLTEIEKLTSLNLATKNIQNRTFEAMRNLKYNLNAEALLREISMSCQIK